MVQSGERVESHCGAGEGARGTRAEEEACSCAKKESSEDSKDARGGQTQGTCFGEEEKKGDGQAVDSSVPGMELSGLRCR